LAPKIGKSLVNPTDANTDSGYNGSGDGSRDNTSSGQDYGSGTGSALGSGSGTGSGKSDGKIPNIPFSRNAERREPSTNVMTKVSPQIESTALENSSLFWTQECAISMAVTTTDSGFCSSYASNKGENDDAERTHQSASGQPEHRTAYSEAEDGGGNDAKSESLLDGSQDRKRTCASQFHYSPFKKRKKSELWYYDKGGSGFSVAVSLGDGMVVHVTDSITQVLGYPKDFWPGQMFMNFIHTKDLIIFNNQLTDCSMESAYDRNGEARNGSFYCRLRSFSGLKHAYSISTAPSYKPFFVKYRVKNVILQGKDVSQEEVTPKKCMTMIVQPLISPFRRRISNNGNFKFMTRQSVFGNLEHLDTNGICTLGFLPQDIVGTCLFHRWHEDDLKKAIPTFQALTENNGKFLSDNYRISTHNGHYITVQTEWCLLLNEYTKTVELVEGNHRLIDGPSNVNVFSGRVHEPTIRHRSLASQVQNTVKEILIQFKERKVSPKDLACLDHSSPLQISGSSESPAGSDNSSKEFQSASANAQKAEPLVPVEIPGLSSLPKETDFQTSWGSYQQLNYAHNIRRFLQSCPKMYATERLRKDEKREGGTEIVVVAPPVLAGSSSAVVHVSEHLSEGGDVAAGYEYAEVATVNDQVSGNFYPKEGTGSGNGSGSKENWEVNCGSSSNYPRSNLTQDMMKIHNSIQEQVYLQQMKNTMGKDAYHPLVAYPYPTSNSQFEPVVQPGTKLTRLK